MLRSMFYMATAVLLSTKTARSGSYLNTESLTSYTCSRYQVFPNLSCTLEPHVTSILEIIVNWYCTISMIAQEREKLKKDEFSTNIPNQGNSFFFRQIFAVGEFFGISQNFNALDKSDAKIATFQRNVFKKCWKIAANFVKICLKRCML